MREELAQQIVSPVQWTRTVEYLADHGVETFVEIGVGQVLAGLIRRIAKGATILVGRRCNGPRSRRGATARLRSGPHGGFMEKEALA